MRTAVVLSHRDIAHELGHLEPWLHANDYLVTRLYREDAPALPDADLLIVMGSPESVAEGYTDERAQGEIEQVSRWLSGSGQYLGICFGAQVLARATGGTVTRLSEAFAGYVNVDAAANIADGPWLIWHNDAITAPCEADVIASLDHADLIFRVGNAWGVQPHIEVTAEILDRMGIGLGAGPEVRQPLVDAVRDHEDVAGDRTARLLDAFLLSRV